MGILTNALSIALGSLLGSRLRGKTAPGGSHLLGTAVLLVALVGFFENMYAVDGGGLSGEHLTVVVLALLAGGWLGELLRLEERAGRLGRTENASRNALMNAFLYFGVGGLQICGPVALAVQGDNSQLLFKSLIDIPFAVSFGAAYGKITALTALPVAAVQLAIAGAALVCGPLFSDALVARLCAMGYLILFFSGISLLTGGRQKVSSLNLLPGIPLVVLLHLVSGVKEWFS